MDKALGKNKWELVAHPILSIIFPYPQNKFFFFKGEIFVYSEKE